MGFTLENFSRHHTFTIKTYMQTSYMMKIREDEKMRQVQGLKEKPRAIFHSI